MITLESIQKIVASTTIDEVIEKGTLLIREEYGTSTPDSSNLSKTQKKELTALRHIMESVIARLRHAELALSEIEARDIFTSFAVHELRTPLTTLVGYAQLLKSRHKEDDGKEATWIREIEKEAQRLTQMIETFLARK